MVWMMMMMMSIYRKSYYVSLCPTIPLASGVIYSARVLWWWWCRLLEDTVSVVHVIIIFLLLFYLPNTNISHRCLLIDIITDTLRSSLPGKPRAVGIVNENKFVR